MLAFALGTSAVIVAFPFQGRDSTVDWPQWRGPERNGLSQETGLLKNWPAAGPPIVWSVATLGAGYGSIATKRDRIFVQGAKDRQSVIYALNRADGKGIWSKALGPAGTNDRGSGPRGTPTVDDDRCGNAIS